MSDSVRPHRRQPTRLPSPWDSPGKNTGVGCHFLLQCMKVKSESEVAKSCLTLSDPMDCNTGDPGSTPGSGRSAGDGIGYPLQYSQASLVAQLVKNLPAMQEIWVGKIPWRRERLPTPVFWPGEFHGLYSPWGHKESDTTE